MNILVFGKNGFLASKLKKHFDKKKIKSQFFGSDTIDLTNKDSAKKLKKLKNKFKVIFLSAITPDKGKDENVYIKNVMMIKNLFDNLNLKNIDHFLYISSDAVFNLDQKRVNSNTAPSPNDLYGLMHFTRENICKFKLPSSKITILRPTIIYGKGDTHNSYGPNRFINQISKNENVKLFGKGLDIRDHLYVDDIIKIILIAIIGNKSGTFNIASGKSYKFIDVVKKIKKQSIKNINVEFIPVNNKPTARYFEVKDTIKKFKINFTSLDKGLKKYLKVL